MAEQINEPPAQHLVATCAPLLAIVVAIVTNAWLYWSFLLCPEGDEACIRFDTALMLRGVNHKYVTDPSVYVGGAMWTLASGTYLLVAVAALVASLYVFREGVGGLKGARGALITVLVLVWAVIIALAPTVLYAKDVGAPAPKLLRGTVGDVLPDINTYNRLFDALGLTVGVMLAVAACAAIRRDPVDDAGGKALRRRMRLLRTVLFAGAAALVVSVLRLSVMLNWAGSFLPAANTPVGQQASTLVTGIVNTLGVYYTILLAAIYVPAALVLRRRAQALADANAQPTETPDAWLAARGLALSYAGLLPRLFAIFAPLLAGLAGVPATSIVKNVLNVQ